MDLHAYGSGKPFEWTQNHLIKLLSTGRDPILTDPIYLNAFRAIDRARFIDEDYRHLAYKDTDIPIGYTEYMNSPFQVAAMLNALKPRFGGRYLELGGGVGYTAAIIGMVAGIAGKVYSLERAQWLWERARKNTNQYPELKNVEVLYRDGQYGLPEKAPYDGILLSYIPEEVSELLKEQLKVRGRLVAPTTNHTLRVITRVTEAEYEEEIMADIATHRFGEMKTGRI